MKNKAILLSSLLMAGSSAFAATITVPPGNGLQAAIAAATEGDTILLESGVYTNADAEIELIVSLTIKAASAAASPIIQDRIVIPSGFLVDKLTIQGVHLDALTAATPGTLNELEILETTLIEGVTQISGINKFTMIGSKMLCLPPSSGNASYLNVVADEVILAGNTICRKDGSNTLLQSTNTGNESLSIIGNHFIEQYHTSISITGWAEAIVAGNRFTIKWANPGYSSTLTTTDFSFITQHSNERMVVRNNLFVNDTARLTAGSVLKRFAPLNNLENVYFENNLVDAGNTSIWVPGLAEAEQAGMMEYHTTTPATLQGNIFMNYNDNILPLPATDIDVRAQYNLCYNNTTNCGTDNGNLETDPMLVNGYKLDSSSPAVDAGPVDPMLSDLDATRNNMGPYGGSWSIDQFDAQREVSTEPYLYPVVDVAKTVANGNVQVKFVSYGRQL